jgi:basic amino acid/polyamine antiporter, APA family
VIGGALVVVMVQESYYNPPIATTYARRLGLFDAVMVVIGGIIGGGIFLNPSLVAQRVGSAPLVLATWVLGGGIALIGALAFAELGARRPDAGGGYVYLREAFGPLPAFLYCWTFLFVVNSGGTAAVAVLFARYAADLAGWPSSVVPFLAVSAILVLAGINYLGIRPGSITLNIFTVLKLAALAAVIVVGLTSHSHATPMVISSTTTPVRAVAVALIPVLFTYGGWAHASNVAGEIVDPARNLPRAMVIGVLVVITVYLSANGAYLNALGVGGLASSATPASDTMRSALGPIGGRLIDAGIAASTFGFVNLCVLSGPRMLQAMAADGLFFSWAARLHPRYRTPGPAIIVQAVWAAALTMSGTYGQLLDYTVFGDWVFFALIVATVFVYHRTSQSTFRMPGYPWAPALFIVIAVVVVLSTVVSSPVRSSIGAAIIGSGALAYAARRGYKPGGRRDVRA